MWVIGSPDSSVPDEEVGHLHHASFGLAGDGHRSSANGDHLEAHERTWNRIADHERAARLRRCSLRRHRVNGAEGDDGDNEPEDAPMRTVKP